MTLTPGTDEDSPRNDDLNSLLRDPDAMKWMGTHLAELRRSVSQHRVRTQTLWIALVAGLVAHIGGYLLRASGLAEPLGLVADLLYALGYSLWTGTVVVALIEIFPQAKERQILEAIDAYEAAVKGRAAGQGD